MLDATFANAIVSMQCRFKQRVQSRSCSVDTRQRKYRRRMRVAGMTLVEVLVVAAVMVLLVALLLPAIHAARAAARRAQCRGNLRALSVGCNAYAASYGVLPPGIVFGFRGSEVSHLALLLPYVGYGHLYDALNFHFGTQDPQNATVASSVVASYLCPTLPRVPITAPQARVHQRAGVSYPGNFGSGSWVRFDGLFYLSSEHPPIALAHITDGAANTAIAAERVPEWSLAEGDYPAELGFEYSLKMDPRPSNRETFVSACLALHLDRFGSNTSNIGDSWMSGFYTMYNHQLVPNERSCTAGVEYFKEAYTASSFHPGGVHVAFADGHASFVSSAIDWEIWRAFGSRDGSESF